MPRRVLKADGKISDLRQIVEQLALEVRNLRYGRMPATPAEIEELLEAIHGIAGDRVFTAKTCLEDCQSGEEQSVRLADAIQRAIRKPVCRAPDSLPSPSSVRSLSRALTRSCGLFGPWQLIQHRAHSNAGSVFRIVKYT